ncbi:hypothetical protein PRNP1_008553 [Phytophthora ramorum]
MAAATAPHDANPLSGDESCAACTARRSAAQRRVNFKAAGYQIPCSESALTIREARVASECKAAGCLSDGDGFLQHHSDGDSTVSAGIRATSSRSCLATYDPLRPSARHVRLAKGWPGLAGVFMGQPLATAC